MRDDRPARGRRCDHAGGQVPPDGPADAIRPDDAPTIEVFDPAAFLAALDEDGDDGFVGPEDERPWTSPRIRTTEDEAWARTIRKIAVDPLKGRRLFVGDAAMSQRLAAATATMPHFGAVTGIIERAVASSAARGRSVAFPPILMLSEPGLGKSHYARSVAGALGTHAVPIALNQTSDRGLLGGSSPVWRGAKMGRLAEAILLRCETASPVYLLDEIDKCSTRAGEDVATILLSALEPENARTFVDEHLDVPIRLDRALWLAGANETRTIAPVLLDRMLVVEVPKPSREQARTIVRAIAAATLDLPLAAEAVEPLLDLSPRKIRQAVELALPFAGWAGRDEVGAEDVLASIELVDGTPRWRRVGFLAGSTP